LNWFGQSWGAFVCQEATHVKTPVGELCVSCNLPILEGSEGFVTPVIGGPLPVNWHRLCFLRQLGLNDSYGANLTKPVMSVRHAALKLDDPEASDFRAECPVCLAGVLRVQRSLETGKLRRDDYCSECMQRFWYLDDTIAGEAL